MKTVVLSDVHLNVSTYGQIQLLEFTKFLRGLQSDKVDRLILLGDLFDFWFEYKHVVFSEYFHILRALADLNEHGIKLHFICGNHDFWAGRFLEHYLGFTIHPDGVRLPFGNRNVLLIHGDGINKKDRGYRLYKRIAKARPVVWLFGLLHPDLAMAIARRVSRTSRKFSGRTDPENGSEAAALREFARDCLGRGDSQVVICGHAHSPTCEQYPTPNGLGLYINTGDWMYHRSYVEWDGQEFRLICPRAAAPPTR